MKDEEKQILEKDLATVTEMVQRWEGIDLLEIPGESPSGEPTGIWKGHHTEFLSTAQYFLDQAKSSLTRAMDQK
jgi:hypothetical protein